MRQKWEKVGCINFSIHGRARAWRDTKVKLAWLPPRHRNITIPFDCLWFGNYYIRLTYTASVHVQLPQRIGCWCQTLSNQLGKVFKLIKLEFQVWKCVQFDWTDWPWVRFHPIGQPSGRHRKSWHIRWNTYQDSYSTVPSANVRL